MTVNVLTTKGVIPIDRLEVRDVVTHTGSTREVATEYRLDGEIVKRSVWIDILCPHELGAVGGTLG